MRFSNPCCSLSENGRLSGSAQTRSAPPSSAPAPDGRTSAARSSAAETSHDEPRSRMRFKAFLRGRELDCQDGPRPVPGGRRPRSAVHDQRLATLSGRPNTVSTPPWVLNLSASPKAPSAPRPAVGSSLLIPAATPIPAQPPMPERTATYCLPLGPRKLIGLPMIPEGVLNLHSSLPDDASTALSQPSMVP